MQAETSNLIKALEKQTGLFRELENILQASRSAYQARNLELIYIYLDKQTSVCARLRELQAVAARTLQMESPDSLVVLLSRPGRFATELRKTLAELAEARQNVLRLNAEQQSFVAGTLHTVRMMNNAFSNFYPTYTQASAIFSLNAGQA